VSRRDLAQIAPEVVLSICRVVVSPCVSDATPRRHDTSSTAGPPVTPAVAEDGEEKVVRELASEPGTEHRAGTSPASAGEVES
jgi:hypothetical protein